MSEIEMKNIQPTVTFNDIVTCKNYATNFETTYTEYLKLSDMVSILRSRKRVKSKRREKYRRVTVVSSDNKVTRVTVIF
jgi:hypothetical protein